MAQAPAEDSCAGLLATLTANQSEPRRFAVHGAEYTTVRTHLEISDDGGPPGFFRHIELGPEGASRAGYERFVCHDGVLALLELVLSNTVVERFEPPLPVMPLTEQGAAAWSWSGTYIAASADYERQYAATARGILEGQQQIDTPLGGAACIEVRIEMTLMADTAVARWELAYCFETSDPPVRLVRRRVASEDGADQRSETWIVDSLDRTGSGP